MRVHNVGYRFATAEPVASGLSRIALEQVDRALGEIADPQLSAAVTVHEVRKRCKKLRGLLRLARPALGRTYQRENRAIRNAARLLSTTRDAAVAVAAFDALVGDSAEEFSPDAVAALRAALAGANHAAESPAGEPLEQFRQHMLELRNRIPAWRMRGKAERAVARGFAEQHRLARQAMHVAFDDPTPERLHEWRKGVKYHGYHLRLVVRVWPRGVKPWIGAATKLGETLGEDHDLAVLAVRVVDAGRQADQATAAARLVELAEAARAQRQAVAREVGKRLFAFRSRDMERWLARLW